MLEQRERVERLLGVVAEGRGEVVARAGRHDRERAVALGGDARELDDRPSPPHATRSEPRARRPGRLPAVVGVRGDVQRRRRGPRAAALELGKELAGPAPPGHRVRPRPSTRMGRDRRRLRDRLPAIRAVACALVSDGTIAGDLDRSRMPRHVAIVMDGNGRWAQQRGLKRTEGHAAGEEALFDTVEGALEIGLAWLTVYAFSTENWRRPLDEVRFLMNFNERLLLRAPRRAATARACGCGSSAGAAGGCPAACCAASRRPRR